MEDRGQGSREGVSGTSPSDKDQDSTAKKPVSKTALIIGLLIVMVLAAAGVMYWLHGRHFVKTDDAYTTGHIHPISARVEGLVVKVLVSDNQVVKAGDVLVQLDPREYEIALQLAESNSEQARAQIAESEAAVEQANARKVSATANVEQAQAQVAQAEAQRVKAQADFDRVDQLMKLDNGAVSKTSVDQATAALADAQAAVTSAKANVSSVESLVAAAKSDITVAMADVQRAKATLKTNEAEVANAKLQLEFCNVVAPTDGRISKKTVEEGQQLSPGQSLMAVVPSDIWVIANLKETQLQDLKIGQEVEIEIDAIDGKTFRGKVDSVQAGSGSTFSLLPTDNATGNFTKIVQRVPVKIVFDPDSIRGYEDRLVPGLSVEPSIDLRTGSDQPIGEQ
ncbi:HlyD family secretion protein [Luteolibacter pohnpeiensis]|uniref:HlyD family secretion protein n=1 Tax=Luteolibacter pohnpeiensis TaxID=454153 RepID=A0A934VXK9_9BACT|nr:HlyD family secretion protein [Luteolibacter pohnpeiensis]MBK1883609.1 HlyD family secretion protein [Luteolibacter pohnpeiensis]